MDLQDLLKITHTPDLTPEGDDSPMSEPPKRWRNKWKALGPYILNGLHREAGEVFWGVLIHPSKEVAEAYGNEDKFDDSEYLGAFPVED